MRLPRAVQAAYLRPLRRQAEHGVPVCNLQLRSFNIPTLEFFADFAMRAAYFLKMPARGPVPLPRIHERWTVPRSNFVHKKSQENFERFTFRRLIQLQDGHADTVRIWLAYLQKHQYHGVGMKANVWEWEALHADADADAAEAAVRRSLQEKAKLFGRRKEARTLATAVELLETAPFRKTMGSVY